MTPTITLRPFRPDDGSALLQLFRDTIRRVNCRDYSPQQIAAWASDDIDQIGWIGRFADRFVVVAEEESQVVGFAELEPNGHIDRFYVSADHQGRGIGRRLFDAVLAHAAHSRLDKLVVEASITARPFFAAMGFETLAEQTVFCRGEKLINYRMRRCLREESTAGLQTGDD